MKSLHTNTFKFRKFNLSTSFHCYLVIAFFMVSLFAKAQEELPRHYTPYNVSIKSDVNTAKNQSERITETVSENGATWLRLFFDDVNLGNNSTITITSNLDGATQTLTTESLKKWKNSSAYFNGDAVTVTLNIAAGESEIGFTIAEIGVGEPDNDTQRSQCGSVDNRVDSTDDAIGRIVPIGCTGWIITNGKLVTAGHCTGSRAQLIEFNVPKSNPDRSIVHPGPEDQYPIGNFITDYVRGQPATDWAVFTASANTQTGLTPIEAQGKSFNVVQSSPGNSITITGFGTDTGIDNQTQQTHTGPTASVTNTFVRYQTDTTGGNSGSPIIDAATGNAVGVHAYGGCRTSGTGSNYGARATITDFWEAMDLGGTTTPPDGCTTIDFNDFQINSFSNQDSAGNFAIQNSGASLSLQNNTWKSISYNYTVTSNTVIEFQFSSTVQGEIHAVGFEDNNSLTSSRYFRVYGTQNYGVGNYDNYPGSGTVTYTIPVGNFYTGTMDRLVFINDNDAGSGNTSVFSNVKIYEGSCGSSLTSEELVAELESATPLLGDEDEGILSSIKVVPNPASDAFSFNLKRLNGEEVSASIYTILGQKKATIALTEGLNTFSAREMALTTGIYLVKVESNTGETVTQKLIIK